MDTLRGRISSSGSMSGTLNGLERIVGYSAYQVAVINGFEGTEEEWLASLKGKDGTTPEKGVDYWTEAEQQEIVDATKAANDAASRAEASTSAANTAAGEATTAAGNATDAANRANTAADGADDVIQNANTAAENAETAAGNAKTAANDANRAAGAANAAAGAANTAASDAASAAASASAAAQSASRAEAALRNAAENGEFNGEDGYTPVKGVDYFDGKDGRTPVKGVDYFDGQDGYTPQKGVDYFDGKDGVPVTHKWEGTTLEITSASGTTSANLKGEKGDTGATGKGLDIQGTYATLSALQAAVTSPEQGDMYNVGAAAPYTIYMFDTTLGWVSQGQLQGAKGTTYTPSVNADGDLSWTNDGGLANPETVRIVGKDGTPGYTPVKGTDYFTEADKQEIAEQAAGLVGTPDVSGQINEHNAAPDAHSDIRTVVSDAQAKADAALPLAGGTMTGAVNMSNNVALRSKASDGTSYDLLRANASNSLVIGSADGWMDISCYQTFRTASSSSKKIDLGTATNLWKNLYLSGNLSDGTNSIKIANIANKSDIPTVPTLTTEEWTFTLEDGSTVTKAVYVG